jgi:MYXO-CTERM domain-containing protein
MRRVVDLVCGLLVGTACGSTRGATPAPPRRPSCLFRGARPRAAVGALLGITALAAPVRAQEPESGAPYDPYPDMVVVTKVRHFDNECWKIASAGGTLYFENGETDGKTGFSSAFDMVGNDWIGNDADRGYNTSPSTGGRHEYRGWPNFGEGNFDHPQRSSGASTRWVDADGNEIPFVDRLEGSHLRMRSSNSNYELEYHFFTTHAAIKILKANDKYAFLFEGPIGGEQERDSDYYVLEDGVRRNNWGSGLGYIDPEFGNKFPSPFFYLLDDDPMDSQVWYVGVKDTAPESAGDEGWIQGSNMVIFSFGRDNDQRAYEGTQAVSVFGFYPKEAGHEEIATFINGRLADPFSVVDAGIGGTGGTSSTGGMAGVGGGAGGVAGSAVAGFGGDNASGHGAGAASGSGGSPSTNGGTTAIGGAGVGMTGGAPVMGGAGAGGGAGAAPGAGTTATSGASGTTGGAQPTGGAADPSLSDDSESGCSFGGSDRAATPAWLAGLALLIGVVRRRRRKVR